jgi:hypothetical protein
MRILRHVRGNPETELVQHPLNSSQESLTKRSIFATVGWLITASKGDNDGCSKV